MRVLLADDDTALLASLRLVLEAAGHEVIAVEGGRAVLEQVAGGSIGAVVCDVNMPDLDGFSVCRQLRAQGDLTPFILLTSRDGEIDEALGLDLGADDYITKPFSMRVLLARLAALVRRTTAAGEPSTVLRSGELEIDRARLEIHYQGQRLVATVTELRLLAALVERPGVVVSRDHLLGAAREDDSVVAPRLVDTYVARLRRKLDAIAAGSGARIETVIGAGYRWCA